jgi:hypothetical protein
MKCQAIITIAMLSIPPAAHAQWVWFQACGLAPPEKNEQLIADYMHVTDYAPRIGPIWFWVPAVHSVVGFTEKKSHPGNIRCTRVYTVGHRMLVVGTVAEVMGKLKAAKH